jgi:adenylate cyclase
MGEQQITRRLAAILAADIAGYSGMMNTDEAGTVELLRQIWNETFNQTVAAHRGRIFKMMGDGALVEFSSAVDAVECAMAIQHAMGERNARAERLVHFRIGINLGDILVEGDDILGDGVNVAARLEGQAPQGGVLASDVVYGQVRGKVGATFIDAGEIKLKNIDRPLRAWRWTPETEKTSRSGSDFGPLLAINKPSIAVLPFSVMSSDPEQEFFADGLVEDILTTLSKLSDLSVIARNSSFVYKGRAVDVRQVARELGVRFVLEGSVRKASNRIRVTAQLIDATTGVHMWADRFDRHIEDIFAVQDEITLALANEMRVRLTEGEQARLRYTTTTNIEAWSLFVEGMRFNRGPHAPGVDIKIRRCWERALALDPGSATLNGLLAVWHFGDARHGRSGDDRETALKKSEAYVERALAIDADNPDAYRALTGILLMKSRFDEAAAAAHKTFTLAPNLPDVLVFAGFVVACCSRAAEGIGYIEKAVALSPNHPAWYLGVLGNSYRLAGRNEEAIRALRGYHARDPGFGLGDLVMVQEQTGHLDEARETAAQLIAARPTFTIAAWLRTQFRNDEEQMAADIASLRRAGVPEQ